MGNKVILEIKDIKERIFFAKNVKLKTWKKRQY